MSDGLSFINRINALCISILAGIGIITFAYTVNQWSWPMSMAVGFYFATCSVLFIISYIHREEQHEMDETIPTPNRMARP